MPPPVPSPVPDPPPGAGVGRADAWFARPAPSTRWRERLDTLDAEERRRLGTLVDATTARAYAVLHLLARDVLGQLAGCRPEQLVFDRTCGRCGGQHGPPSLVGHPVLHVSLSRTRDLVAVAVSTDAPVGVDVERVADTRFEGFDAVATHPTEQTRDLDDRARAVSWVRKEAALKALGTGLLVDPGRLRTPQPGHPEVLTPGRPAVSVVDLHLEGESGHVAALALAAAYGDVEVTLHRASTGD